MKKFVMLRLKMNSYLTNEGYFDKNAKNIKNSVIKHEVNLGLTKTVWRIMRHY